MRITYLLILALVLSTTIVIGQKKRGFVIAEQGGGEGGPVMPSTEIGFLFGASYYLGELNSSRHFHPNYTHPSYGIVIRRNFNSRWAFRLNGIYAKVSGHDAFELNYMQSFRKANFNSIIYEGSGVFEFTYFRFNPTDKRMYFTPFVFGGPGVFYFDPKSTAEGGVKINLAKQKYESVDYLQIQPSFVFGYGFRYKLNNRILWTFEWGMRKTWTDYLDDVSYRYPDSFAQRGDPAVKDWYSVADVILTFRLGGGANSCPQPNTNQYKL